jgi:hypothetical protein
MGVGIGVKITPGSSGELPPSLDDGAALIVGDWQALSETTANIKKSNFLTVTSPSMGRMNMWERRWIDLIGSKTN